MLIQAAGNQIWEPLFGCNDSHVMLLYRERAQWVIQWQLSSWYQWF